MLPLLLLLSLTTLLLVCLLIACRLSWLFPSWRPLHEILSPILIPQYYSLGSVHTLWLFTVSSHDSDG
jgi:hypothetical protein